MLKDEVRLQEYVDNGFKKLFFNIPKEERAEYNGIQLINSAVITRYLKQLLENDLRYAPFTFSGSEHFVSEDIDIRTPRGILKSRIGGIIDRLDTKDGTLRIVDYKTGAMPIRPPMWKASSCPTRNGRPTYSRPFSMPPSSAGSYVRKAVACA